MRKPANRPSKLRRFWALADDYLANESQLRARLRQLQSKPFTSLTPYENLRLERLKNRLRRLTGKPQ